MKLHLVRHANRSIYLAINGVSVAFTDSRDETLAKRSFAHFKMMMEEFPLCDSLPIPDTDEIIDELEILPPSNAEMILSKLAVMNPKTNPEIAELINEARDYLQNTK